MKWNRIKTDVQELLKKTVIYKYFFLGLLIFSLICCVINLLILCYKYNYFYFRIDDTLYWKPFFSYISKIDSDNYKVHSPKEDIFVTIYSDSDIEIRHPDHTSHYAWNGFSSDYGEDNNILKLIAKITDMKSYTYQPDYSIAMTTVLCFSIYGAFIYFVSYGLFFYTENVLKWNWRIQISFVNFELSDTGKKYFRISGAISMIDASIMISGLYIYGLYP